MPIKLPFAKACNGLSTKLNATDLITSPIPSGGAIFSAAATNVNLVGKIKLKTTAVNAATNVPTRYNTKIGLILLSEPTSLFAMVDKTIQKIKIGAIARNDFTKN